MTFYAVDSKRQARRSTGIVNEVFERDGKRKPSETQARDEDTGDAVVGGGGSPPAGGVRTGVEHDGDGYGGCAGSAGAGRVRAGGVRRPDGGGSGDQGLGEPGGVVAGGAAGGLQAGGQALQRLG